MRTAPQVASDHSRPRDFRLGQFGDIRAISSEPPSSELGRLADRGLRGYPFLAASAPNLSRRSVAVEMIDDDEQRRFSLRDGAFALHWRLRRDRSIKPVV